MAAADGCRCTMLEPELAGARRCAISRPAFFFHFPGQRGSILLESFVSNLNFTDCVVGAASAPLHKVSIWLQCTAPGAFCTTLVRVCSRMAQPMGVLRTSCTVVRCSARAALLDMLKLVRTTCFCQ